MTDPNTDPVEDVDEIDPEPETDSDEIVEIESTEEEDSTDDDEEEGADPDSPDLTAGIPVTVLDEIPNLIVREMLQNIAILVNTYTTAHAVQTGQHSDSFIGWLSNLRAEGLTDEEKSAPQLQAITALHDWLWTDASPAQLLSIRPMLDEMLLDVNRALMNRQQGIKDTERAKRIDLKAARADLVDKIDGIRATARSNILPGFTEDLILGLPEIVIKAKKNSPDGVYAFPSAPKVMSADTEKKKNGGHSFRQHNTQVRILVNGKLYSNHPATLGAAVTYYLHKSVKDAGKLFEDWKSGASWTDTKTGDVYTWCFQEDAPSAVDFENGNS